MENKKTFEQLTDVELLALSQEDIDWYVKLKKAEAGVKILNCPETPLYRDIPEKDLTVYQVCGYSFADKGTAQEIADLINSKNLNAMEVDYDYSHGSDYKYAKPYEGSLTNVEIKKVFTLATYTSIKDILISNKKIEDAYNKVKREYDNEEEKANEVTEIIYTTITEARERKVQQEEYVTRIQEYLRLSNGDTTIAWNFFDKAYSVETSVKTKILESKEYIEAVEGYKIIN